MTGLYYYPGNASLAVHILLEELGDPVRHDTLALRARQLAKYQSTAARRV